jgi:ADP-ribose pyrophosphatase
MSDPPPLPDADVLLVAKRFRVVRLTHSGADGRPHQREIIRHPGAVVILPLLDDGRVGLVRNYRASIDEALWELPAGTLEPGEDPLAAAHRELAEETGFWAERMELLATFFSSPGIMDERMHLFVAERLRAGSQHLDEGEQIELAPAGWDECLAMARNGQIRDAKTLVGLLYYHAFRRAVTAGQ